MGRRTCNTATFAYNQNPIPAAPLNRRLTPLDTLSEVTAERVETTMCQSLAEGGRRCRADMERLARSGTAAGHVTKIVERIHVSRDAAIDILTRTLLDGRDEHAGQSTATTLNRAVLAAECAYATTRGWLPPQNDTERAVVDHATETRTHARVNALKASPEWAPAVTKLAETLDMPASVAEETLHHELVNLCRRYETGPRNDKGIPIDVYDGQPRVRPTINYALHRAEHASGRNYFARKWYLSSVLNQPADEPVTAAASG